MNENTNTTFRDIMSKNVFEFLKKHEKMEKGSKNIYKNTYLFVTACIILNVWCLYGNLTKHQKPKIIKLLLRKTSNIKQ